MAPLLYLDTARLGRMTPAAQRAQLDFVRLSAEEPSSLYFEQFLRDGFSAWPSSYQAEYPGLEPWQGIAGLKQSLRQIARAPGDWQVLLASRSLPLVEFASTAMFRVCRNVLTTDLSWPTYQQVIENKARTTNNQVSVVPLREQVFRHNWTDTDVASFLSQEFAHRHCDGLFLPVVNHLGIRLPVRTIVQRIEANTELRFCFLDAAQAICHTPLDDCATVADFMVAGTHKWMGAHLPMGIGLFGRRRSRDWFESRLKANYSPGDEIDPLLRFSQQLQDGELNGHSETTNLTPLFACAGAVSDFTATPEQNSLDQSVIASQLAEIAIPDKWHPHRPHSSLRSRIVLFESEQASLSQSTETAIRQTWLDAGYIVTGYPNGWARVSMPQ